MGSSIIRTVRKAAKLAVYDAVSIRVKSDHKQLTILVDGACGLMSMPFVSKLKIMKSLAIRRGRYKKKHKFT